MLWAIVLPVMLVSFLVACLLFDRFKGDPDGRGDQRLFWALFFAWPLILAFGVGRVVLRVAR